VERKVYFADYEKQKRALAEYPIESVDELYEFGRVLADEVQQRSSHVDSKLGVYLGFSVATIALLSAGSPKEAPEIIRWIIFLSTGAAVIAMILAAIGLRSREWAFPSELDWFNENAVLDHKRLRRNYVLALLKSHQVHQERSLSKAALLPATEIFMAVSGVLAAASIMARI
jgi:hypothetical protein